MQENVCFPPKRVFFCMSPAVLSQADSRGQTLYCWKHFLAVIAKNNYTVNIMIHICALYTFFLLKKILGCFEYLKDK